MRILHINAAASGGAFRAMERLHRGLLAAGEDSLCLLQMATTGKGMLAGRGRLGARLWPRLDGLPLRLYPGRVQEEFNLQWVPGGILDSIKDIKPDVVHLHWVHRSFMRNEDLRRIEQPVVWTLHDSWLFTGGCHVPSGCERYRIGCGKCPKLGSSTNWDLSRWVWNRKKSSWCDTPLTLVAPSRWMEECVASSPLTGNKELKIIPNGIDLKIFNHIDNRISKEILGIRDDSKVILFGSIGDFHNTNKGGQFIKPAIEHAKSLIGPLGLELLIVGADPPNEPLDMGAPTRYLGRLHDDVAMRLAFCAADVTVVPSMQESFGQMASESLACGTPVAAFNATGLRDIVDHGINGFLAAPYDAEQLGECVAAVLNSPDSATLRRAAREKAQREFDINTMVERYMQLYQSLTISAGRSSNVARK